MALALGSLVGFVAIGIVVVASGYPGLHLAVLHAGPAIALLVDMKAALGSRQALHGHFETHAAAFGLGHGDGANLVANTRARDPVNFDGCLLSKGQPCGCDQHGGEHADRPKVHGASPKLPAENAPTKMEVPKANVRSGNGRLRLPL